MGIALDTCCGRVIFFCLHFSVDSCLLAVDPGGMLRYIRWRRGTSRVFRRTKRSTTAAKSGFLKWLISRRGGVNADDYEVLVWQVAGATILEVSFYIDNALR
jgi:hypothetical protein